MKLTLLVVLLALAAVAQGLAMLLGLEDYMMLTRLGNQLTFYVLAGYYILCGLYYMLTKRHPNSR